MAPRLIAIPEARLDDLFTGADWWPGLVGRGRAFSAELGSLTGNSPAEFDELVWVRSGAIEVLDQGREVVLTARAGDVVVWDVGDWYAYRPIERGTETYDANGRGLIALL